MTSELIHYSGYPLHLENLTRKEQAIGNKPSGLWVSDGSDWKDWCLQESFEEEHLRFASRVELMPDASILRLESYSALSRFTEAYRKDNQLTSNYTLREIDWPAVADAYSGILIMPYQWEARLAQNTFWYYGWDVSSGCIWEPTAIQSVTHLEYHPVSTALED